MLVLYIDQMCVFITVNQLTFLTTLVGKLTKVLFFELLVAA